MEWKFYPEKGYETLNVSGRLEWRGLEADAEFEVFGADPENPLRIYGVDGKDYYYFGLMMPQGEKMSLSFKRNCPEFSELIFTIGRAEEDYILVATGEVSDLSKEKLDIDDAPKLCGDEDAVLLEIPWEKKTEAEQETEQQQFLFAHPSTQANLKFYGHYCKWTQGAEILYAFCSSFGPHPLPHLAKYACWYDVDFNFGYRGYFIIGLREEQFFLPDFNKFK